MRPFLRIIRKPYEEPYHLNLLVSASNGRQLAGIEIYANATDILSLAGALRRFPKHEEVVLWELGSERPEDRFAFYYRLRIFQVTARGECALELRLNNNEEPPDREVAEFSIRALPADLDRLADLLEGFSALEDEVLEWSVQEGELRDDAEDVAD